VAVAAVLIKNIIAFSDLLSASDQVDQLP